MHTYYYKSLTIDRTVPYRTLTSTVVTVLHRTLVGSYTVLQCSYMGGGQSTEAPTTEVPAVELESWFTEMKYENSTTVSEALSSCYGALENTWSSKSGNYRVVSETKLRTSISSCKGFLSLAISKELSTCRDNGDYWYRVNVASGATSTILFIFMTILLTRLRRSNRIKNKLKSYRPHLDVKKKSFFSWMRKSPSPGQTHPAMTPAYQPLHMTSPSTPAFSTSNIQESDYNYILENPYNTAAPGPAQLSPVFMPRAQLGPMTSPGPPRTMNSPALGSTTAVPGAPSSPYPTLTPRGQLTGPNTAVPTPTVRQHVEIRQAETIDSGQILQGAEMDRIVYIVTDKTQSTE